MADTIDSGLCIYYRNSHCTMAYPCPWGKSRLRGDKKKECIVFGKIMDAHKLGGKK